MLRRRLLVLCLVAAPPAGAAYAQVSRHGLIDPFAVEALGLTRPWWAQAPVAPSEKVVGLALHDGVLCLQTDGGLFHAMDAATGEAMWSQRWTDYPVGDPAFDGRRVAIMAGPHLIVASLDDGSVLWRDRSRRAATGAVALYGETLFSPDARGVLRSFDLTSDLQIAPPFASRGRVVGAPIANGRVLAWSNDDGEVFMSYEYRRNTEVRIVLPAGVSAPLAYQEPQVLVASADGFLYALDDSGGDEIWSYSAGDRITEAPVPVGDRIYLVDEFRNLHCVAAASGEPLWVVQGVKRYAAASSDLVFGVNPRGELIVLSAADGGYQFSLPTAASTVYLANRRSDRVFLAKTSGLVQCLHDAAQTTPATYWSPPAARDADEESNSAPAADGPLFDLQ